MNYQLSYGMKMMRISSKSKNLFRISFIKIFILFKSLYISENFIDPTGFLKLSNSLTNSFSCWKRPKELFPSDKLCLKSNIVKPNQIKQTQVGIQKKKPSIKKFFFR